MIRGLLFLAPVALVVLPLEFLFYRSGESWTAHKVIAHQQKYPDAVYSRVLFSQQFNRFKTVGIQTFRPEILTVGSSRVLKFRKEMFAPMEDRFFNAGSIAQRIGDVLALADQIQTGAVPRPRLLILGLDPWWLGDDANPDDTWLTGEQMEEAALSFAGHVEAARTLIRKPELFSALIRGREATPAYGLSAMGVHASLYGSGFRVDGSKLAEKDLLDYIRDPVFKDRETPPIVQRIRERTQQFKPKQGINPEALDRLIDALKGLQQSGTEVMVFQPPFSTACHEALAEAEDLAEWWRAYREDVPARLEAAGIPCMTILKSEQLGLDDRYMLDGFHPSEVWVARLMERMIDRAGSDSVLAAVDRARLEALSRAEGVIPVSFNPPQIPGESARLSGKTAP
ncbi:MAG: hypothetical protein QNK37_27505 [Acidobacteriota bacterium]|nr:hypothetical protein [Acidobacteriota bacterium]